MRIAIVEDNKMDMDRLCHILDAYAKRHGLPAEIYAYSDGDAFLSAFAPKKYDLIFLDNYIGSGLGIDVARKVRAEDKKAALVFVSMSGEFAVPGFEVNALHYLIKPVTPNEIEKVFRRFLGDQPEPDKETIEVTIDHLPVQVPLDSIHYIEISNRTCTVHCSGEDLNVYATLDSLEAMLPKALFLRPNRSVVLRMSYIRVMNASCFILKNGVEIPIGRQYRADCRKAYMEYMTNQ